MSPTFSLPLSFPSHSQHPFLVSPPILLFHIIIFSTFPSSTTQIPYITCPSTCLSPLTSLLSLFLHLTSHPPPHIFFFMSIKRSKLFHDFPSTPLHHYKEKPQMTMHDDQQQQEEQLIPGLPDHIAHLCLSKIHPTKLYSICPLWRRLIYSPLFPPFLNLYAILTPTSNPTTSPHTITFSCYDPVACMWQPLPAPPDPPLQLLLSHPSYISRSFPLQSLSCGGRLVIVAATTQGPHLPALPRPLVFDPVGKSWSYGPPLPVPRRWCAAGALAGSVFVASGVGSHFSLDTARSVERWDLGGSTSSWAKTAPMKNGRFSREAVAAVGWRGRLFLVNVSAKEGAVYDARGDTWRDMKEGMVAGWLGPAASMDENEVYVVDEGKGVLRKYDEWGDKWVDVLENETLRGAQQMAAGGGRVCVVCDYGRRIAVVDVVARPVKMWVVELPIGYKAVAVHVLPRMCRTDV